MLTAPSPEPPDGAGDLDRPEEGRRRLPADGEGDARALAGLEEPRDDARRDHGDQGRAANVQPQHGFEQDVAVARRSAEHGVPGVAENDDALGLRIRDPNRLVDAERLALHEGVPQGPCMIGQFVGEALRQRTVVVRHHDRGPSALADVEPGLHRERRGLEHARIGLHGAGAVEPLLHRTVRGEELLLMRHQGDLAHRDHRPEAFLDHAKQQSAADQSGVEGIVRLGAVPDDGVDRIDHPARHVGVVVEAEQDRHVGSEDLAAEVRLLALDIVEAHGRAGPVKLEVQPV